MQLQWGHVMGAFIVGLGTALLLLKGSGPNTRRDALRRFKVLSRRLVRPVRGPTEEERQRRQGQRRNQRYPLSCVDRVVCPITCINMHYFFERTLDPAQLEASLCRLVTKHPFLAGTFRGWLQSACVVCDDHGVEFTVAESAWSLEDVHYASPALERLSQYEPCGFGAGTLWDLFWAVVYRAPVCRARLTQLQGGGSALSLSVAHTVMDAKSVMKTIELWAKETRNAAALDDSTSSSLSSSSSSSWSLDDEVLLGPSTLDQIAASAARTAAWSPQLLLWELAYDAFHGIRQTLALLHVFGVQGLETRTFFFPDAKTAEMKATVMRRIKQQPQQQDSNKSSNTKDDTVPAASGVPLPAPPAFVSTNDVLCAAVWKAVQGLKSRPAGPSVVHVNVDVRGMLTLNPSPPTDDDFAASFYMGNGVLQCAARDDDPACSPLPTLSRAIRRAISDFDTDRVAAHIGFLKKKETQGLLLGPLGMDYRFSHDVIFSSFHPLQADHDFGTGPAFLYHLDLVPALALYAHIHRGSDLPAHEGWLPKGLYVQLTLPAPCMDELLREHPDFVPVSAPVRRSKAVVVPGKARGEEEEEGQQPQPQPPHRAAPVGGS